MSSSCSLSCRLSSCLCSCLEHTSWVKLCCCCGRRCFLLFSLYTSPALTTPPREPGELRREEGPSLRLWSWLLMLWLLQTPRWSLLLLLLLLLFSFSRLPSWLWSPALGRTNGELLMPRMMFSTRARLARRCSSDSLSRSKEERERG